MATEHRESSIPLPNAGRESSRESASIAPDTGSGGRSNTVPMIVALVVGLILGALGWMLLGDSGGGDQFGGRIDDERFQAVILSNDKVYFGRLDDVSDTFYALDDAFFLREVRETPDAEPQRSLLPVNRELHAPENRMLIRKDEVVLVENLAEDSPVLTEIQRQQGDG